MYSSLGRLKEAQPLLERSLRIRKANLRPNHPSLAITMNNIALLYARQRKYKKAIPLQKKTLEIFEESLGKNHVNIAIALRNLAASYRALGQKRERANLKVALLQSIRRSNRQLSQDSCCKQKNPHRRFLVVMRVS